MHDLIDQPANPGQGLTLTTGNEDLQFEIILPSTATASFQNIDVGVDIVFVGLS
jgi:hypothetical protein